MNRTALIAAAVTVAATLAVGAVAATQTKPTQEGRTKGAHHRKCGGGHFAKFMGQKLNLTDVQKEKLKAIRTDAKEKAKAIKANQSIDKDAKRAQFKALKDSVRLQVDQVLTQDQKNQIKKMRDEAKERRAARKALKPTRQA